MRSALASAKTVIFSASAMEIKGRDARGLEEFFRDASYERVCCNLCGRDGFFALAERDALGLAVRTVMCSACGLIFINPRLTKDWYAKYYAYNLRGYKHGAKMAKEELGWGFERARRHGHALAERFRQFLLPGVAIDVGSAEGGLLTGVGEIIAIDPIGIEPKISRAELARKRGIPTYASLVEDIGTAVPDLPRAANIFCTKSLNHFLDPAYFLRWAHRTLDADGRLVLEVKNFRQQARASGRISAAIQIDHPFMFLPETLEEFVRAAGFEVFHSEADESKSRAELAAQKLSGLPVSHIRLVARKTDRQPFSDPVPRRPQLVARLRREFSPSALFAYYLFHHATPARNFLRKFVK